MTTNWLEGFFGGDGVPPLPADVVYVDPVAPDAYVLDLIPGTSAVDLSTVTAVTLEILKPDASITTWSTVLSNQTARTLTAAHTFVSGNVDQVGVYVIYASLTVPAGTVRSASLRLTARSRFEV